MIKIAIVEDENKCAETLEQFIEKFGRENELKFSVTKYSNAVDFLTNYKPVYDLVFMDILMPDLNGMEAAKKLRQVDDKTMLIFVTNLAQYAVKGYEVNALDFIVKPIAYHDFAFKMQKATKLIKLNEDRELVIACQGGIRRLSVKSIFYLEVVGHKLVWHTTEGEIVGNGTLGEMEEKLKDESFLRCNSCYLVNPKHIAGVKKYDLQLTNGEVLQISQPRKRKFMADFAEWLSKGNFLC